jgi:hypothetical protein
VRTSSSCGSPTQHRARSNRRSPAAPQADGVPTLH